MARMEIWSSEYYDREIEFSYSRLRACLWCKIHISWQMGYGQVPELLQCRTYEPAGNTTDLSHSKENFECIHEPLLNIPLTHVIDPWWTTFIAKSNQQTTAKYDWWTVQQRYAIEDFNWGGQPKERYLTRLVKEINELGSFSIWNKKNADGSKEFTTLLGLRWITLKTTRDTV